MSSFASIQKFRAGEGVHAWALDFPALDAQVTVSERGLYLQGWVLTKPGVVRGPMIVRGGAHQNGKTRSIGFNNDRRDVVQRILGVAADAHPQLKCGFIAYLGDVPTDFELGVTLDGEVTWLCQVQLHGKPVCKPKSATAQVIQGTDGWLFLDNDTNRSVDQHTGRLTLDQAGLRQWRTYLDKIEAMASVTGARHAIVIAASKEQVLPEHYPHQRGEMTVQDQVLALCAAEHHVIDTAALLTRQADRAACFMKTDTHWTDRAAKLAVLAMLKELGLDEQEASCRLAADVYYTMPFTGDLGVKLTPTLAAPTEFMQAPPPASGAVFDNALPNIGRVLIFESRDGVWPRSLLIFGASSSYQMLKYLKRLFNRVVFVHSAGNVDPGIVRHERPDLLVTQTTARFMVEAPGTAFSLREAVKSKLDNTRGADPRLASSLESPGVGDTRNALYVEMSELPDDI